MLTARTWILAAGLIGGLGVVLGAFGSHVLPNYLQGFQPPLSEAELGQRAEAYEIGVRYQIYHALALLALGVLAYLHDRGTLRLAGGLMILGTVLFSGGLYLVALFHVPRWIHLVVPLGGSVLILGWLALIAGGVTLRRQPAD